MASAISSSLTVTMRAAPREITSSASGSGTRQAMPSANVAAELVEIGLPAATESAMHGALAATTPTTSVSAPSRSRAMIMPHAPEPMPIGT